MLEFARRIGLGVDVADLLELEGSFKRYWVVHAATEKECMLLLCETLGPVDHLRLEGKHRRKRRGDMTQRLEFIELAFRGEASVDLRKRERKEINCCELCGKGLRRGNADFYASTSNVGETTFAHHGRCWDIADRQCPAHT